VKLRHLKKTVSPLNSRARYPELDKQLVAIIRHRRSKGGFVSRYFVIRRARILAKELGVNFKASYGWSWRFMRRNKIVRKRRSNKKRKALVERLPDLKKWHRNFREMLKHGDADKLDPKWGRYPPQCRFNVDQSPAPFAMNLKETYTDLDDQHVHLASAGHCGLDKRQCTLQLVFSPDLPADRQPKPGIIFRGKGTRIPRSETEAYHTGVHVYWQPKAWVDRPTAVKWAGDFKKDLAQKSFPDEKDAVDCCLLMDNLDAQWQKPYLAELKKVVKNKKNKSIRVFPWFHLADSTDLSQAVDAGYAAEIKVEMARKQDEWMDTPENLDKWCSGELTAGDRRILLTHWLGEAVEVVHSKPPNETTGKTSLWRYFEKTGCLMTIDGSGDELIHLQVNVSLFLSVSYVHAANHIDVDFH
jgi:hypothetical protein